MAESFYTILTNVGKAKIANATALGTKVNFTTLKVGDSNGTYYNPTETQEDLVHTVWNGNINSITTDPDNPNWITIAVVIPSNVGGFTIREVGIFDDAGDMLAIGKYPETYKPQVADGSTKDIMIRMILEVSNSASVTLKVDPTVTLATKEDFNALAGAGRTAETVKKNADDIKDLAGAGRTTETIKGNADALNAHISDNEQSFTNLNNIINNLNTNDIEARREILDIKLKLDENEVIEFISKTGIGFFDLFKDTSNIDTANSTASIANADAIFTEDQLLKFLTQAFEEFKNVELALYDLSRESIKVDADVNDGSTIEATVSPDSIATGDKFYFNGEIYTVSNVQLVEGQ